MLLPHGLQVLVVESQSSMRAQLRNMLASIGIDSPQFAVSASMAMRRLRAQPFDLILSAYDLGEGQDGQHLLEDLRQHAIIPPDTVFVMITGERNYERVISACELVPNDYILKPLTAESLRVGLLRAFEKRDAFLPVWQLMKLGDPVGAARRLSRGARPPPAVPGRFHAPAGGAARPDRPDRRGRRDRPTSGAPARGFGATVTTLERLRQADQCGPQRPLVLLVGADAFAGLPGWYRWHSLFDLAHLAVAHRPGFAIDAAQLPAALAACYRERLCTSPSTLSESPSGRIVTFAMTQLAISATQIRRLLASGGSVRYLLPDTVIAYIQDQHLYPEY